MNYYNEWDKRTAAWLRELIKEGHIANGIVDERSICDVQPSDLDGFTQCHFFAGIGGWSYALRLAGWPDDRPVWTGSCPCQPFSKNGRGRGGADDRNLWMPLFGLIQKRKPDKVFGEQVDRAVAYGWLDRVSADLEDEAYSFGACILGAHSAGSPHIRQRIYWVADAERERVALGRGASPVGLACNGCCGIRQSIPQGLPLKASEVVAARRIAGPDWSRKPSPTWVAHGIPGRVGIVRGYGNAIVPQVAAEFILACEEAVADRRAE